MESIVCCNQAVSPLAQGDRKVAGLLLNSVFTNPATAYFLQHDVPGELEDVLRFARWLRQESNIAVGSPVDLAVIYQRFGIPSPERTTLPDQQGLLLDANTGFILINESDPWRRQRFTEAHELMEFLFAAAQEDPRWRGGQFTGRRLATKERWCNEGAAELMMPVHSIRNRVETGGCSLASGRQLANDFELSLTASLWQMIKVCNHHHAIVLWRPKHKPTELRKLSAIRNQIPMFGSLEDYLPPKRLRVEWSVVNTRSSFIPKDKSIEDDAAVYAAWRDGVPTSGEDTLRERAKITFDFLGSSTRMGTGVVSQIAASQMANP
jgi:IrrE N-terminal-like domain